MAILAATLTGCASVYVDGSTPEVPRSQFTPPAHLEPVQVLFEFQTKGVANLKATELLKARAITQVQDSGLFKLASEQPAPGAGMLSISLNNVPMTDDAFTKGFVTGLTFGLAGSKVSDGYICTAKYSPANGDTPVVKSARHAIHTTMGTASAPGNATKADNPAEAAYTMLRQVLSQVLNDLSKDPNFKP
jgi:hypothetical protein